LVYLERRMKSGFYKIMAAQFFSSLADNALLIAAIALLVEMKSPSWMTPLLKLFFVLSYVLLAAFVGAFADALPKGKVMFITNLVKIAGCAMMFATIHPLLSYAIVGFGAAAYSPAKYGILTELLPSEQLVMANGWIEGLTIVSIILGTVLGGALINPHISAILLKIDIPFIDTGINTSTEASLSVIMSLYLVSTFLSRKIPLTGVTYPHQEHNPFRLIADFANCFRVLWRDRLGQISLAVTTLFWGAAAALQFIVLKWAEKSLHMPLDKAAILQGVTAIGVALGAVAAAHFVPLKKSLSVLPLGVGMGLVVIAMTLINDVRFAYPLLILIGGLSGYYLVPMNALLQHRGHVLLSAGHSIAVQNFNENLSVLAMLTLYALLVKLNINVNYVIVLFGLFISGVMLLIMRKHATNQRQYDSLYLIGETKH
jgi:LPLT family lysophospholipid transporter-like MFS transporter